MTVFYLGTLCVFILYLIIEYTFLQSRIRTIPLRILVNGTRGKSTTVKIIHDILQKSGKNVFSKTTGDVPLLILPDGRQETIKRFAPASIIENIRILRKIAQHKPEAIILECMALQPETQRVLSRFIFKSNYTAITNIFFDHAEVMGPDIKETAQSIAECFHKDSLIILSDKSQQLIKTQTHYHPNTLKVENKEFHHNFENIPKEIINENWSLISAIAAELNLDTKIVMECFAERWQSISSQIRIPLPQQKAEVWDLFSANDIESSKSFMQNRLGGNLFSGHLIFYLNCRADRPLRTKYFVNFISDDFAGAEIWLTGDGRYLAKKLLKKYAMRTKLISDQEAFRKITSGFAQETLLFCLGNHKGMDDFISEINNLAENQQGV